jgi:protein-S-isoprenylcysteine O-methyltransferase Ste14
MGIAGLIAARAVPTVFEGRAIMFLLIRTVTYATLFVGFVLIYLPARLLAWSGIARPEVMGWQQICGAAVGALGGLIALACVSAFAFIGKGTPAPFDPPRRLVVRGPYRFVRNPMYIGAALALAGAALFFQSALLFAFVVGFLVVTHLFVLIYEEPTLRRSFGPEYLQYCRKVHRWWPTAHPIH